MAKGEQHPHSIADWFYDDFHLTTQHEWASLCHTKRPNDAMHFDYLYAKKIVFDGHVPNQFANLGDSLEFGLLNVKKPKTLM